MDSLVSFVPIFNAIQRAWMEYPPNSSRGEAHLKMLSLMRTLPTSYITRHLGGKYVVMKEGLPLNLPNSSTVAMEFAEKHKVQTDVIWDSCLGQWCVADWA